MDTAIAGATAGSPRREQGLGFALLNDWQRDFPLTPTPFEPIAAALGVPVHAVLDTYRQLQRDGAISRIGGIWGAGAAGAAMLCAYAVPPSRLQPVAAIVSAQPGVNHNYEREHRYNLWFVVHAPAASALHRIVDALDAACDGRALRLRMQRAYRIDLGFDLRAALAASGPPAAPTVAKVDDAALAALLEQGLPLVERPFDGWARALGRSPDEVLATLQRWLRQGTLRRFGAIVRHHEAGFVCNAMTVFDVDDATVDAHGAALAAQAGVTLCYRRERAGDWPFNLYCMVHGRDRAAVRGALDAAIEGAGLTQHRHAVLFSRRRFKQTGATPFRGPTLQADAPCRPV